MRFSRNLRRLGAATAIAAVVVLGTALPAAADVTVEPNTAQQGASAELVFNVTNESVKAAMTQVRLVMPPSLPMAEVTPLSIPHWGPLISTRQLKPPLKNLHGDGYVTDATTAIEWYATAGNALLPGSTVGLQIALGPMPEEATQMQFTFVPTYDDGSTGPAIPPATITLTPATPGQAGAHGSAHGEQAEQAAPEAAAPTADASDDPGTNWANLTGWLAAAFCAGFAGVLLLRRREGDAVTPEGDQPSAADAMTNTAPGAGNEDTHRARVSAWSYRDQS